MNRHDFELLGDRHKFYEGLEDHTIMPGLPTIIRLDGRAFHTFTRGMEKPYDKNFSHCMVETTKRLVQAMHATVGYTQSDEISLAFINPDAEKLMSFGGRVQKLASISASIASVNLNKFVEAWDEERAAKDPVFDARVYAYPNEDLTAESFLWRETDATRNSLAMAAQAHFSHKELEGKNRREMYEMLLQKGINWNDYPTFFKKGTYVKRSSVERVLTEEELARIPEKHRPTGPVTRGTIIEIDIPPAEKIENLSAVLFHGAVPVLKTAAISTVVAKPESTS